MSYARPIAVVIAAALSACDPAAGGDASTTDLPSGSTGAPLPDFGQLTCATVGDGCLLALGGTQCGERMACVHLPGQHPEIGTCVAPCSEASECAIGKCNYDVGACYGDASELVAPVACE
jgi:hypothetical protein